MVRRWVSAAGGLLGRPADGLGFHHVTEKEEVAGRKKVYIRRLVSLHLVEPVRFSRQACIEGQGAATRALVSSREPPPKPAASGWLVCLPGYLASVSRGLPVRRAAAIFRGAGGRRAWQSGLVGPFSEMLAQPRWGWSTSGATSWGSACRLPAFNLSAWQDIKGRRVAMLIRPDRVRAVTWWFCSAWAARAWLDLVGPFHARGCGVSPPRRAEARGGRGKHLAPRRRGPFLCLRSRTDRGTPGGGGCKLKTKSRVNYLCSPSYHVEPQSRFSRSG